MLALGIACTVAAVAWAYLAAGHGGYWRTSQWLPSATSPSPPGEPSRWPEVVAVIPARNEAAVLPAVLPTLLGQDYPGTLTVIVVDDCSSDGTAEAAAELRPRPGPGPRGLRVVAGAPLPPGWGPSPAVASAVPSELQSSTTMTVSAPG